MNSHGFGGRSPGNDPVFAVSPRLRGDFENGRTYYPMHGVAVTVPTNPALAPDPTQLRWHNDTIFRS